MKFQWYIVNLDEATVEGSNDVERLEPYINDEGYVILSAQHGCFYQGSRDPSEVEELSTPDDLDEDDMDDVDEEDEDPADAENEADDEDKPNDGDPNDRW